MAETHRRLYMRKPEVREERREERTSAGEGNLPRRSPDLQGPVAPSPRRRQTCQVALGKANIGGTSR